MKGVPADDTDRNPTVAPDAPASPARPRRLAPRNPTPAMASGGTSSTLPDDVAAEQVQRLSAFALVAGGLWAIGLLMDSVVFPLALGATVPRVALVIEGLGIAGAIATYAWVRYSGQLAPEEVRRRAVADDAERGRHRPAGNLGHRPDDRDASATCRGWRS